MEGYDPAAIWADKEIRKKKLLELVKKFPKEYQIYEFKEGWENLRIQNKKWRVSIMVKESFNDEKLTAVEIQLQEYPCEYKAIEKFLSDMDYNYISIKTYRSTTDVAADDILKKILTDFESFDKKFNQTSEPEPEEGEEASHEGYDEYKADMKEIYESKEKYEVYGWYKKETKPEPKPVSPKFQLREKVSLRTSDDIHCIIYGIKICKKFNYVYYVKICEYASLLGPIEYVHHDDILMSECELVKYHS
jgi:hypothetical protein